MASKTTRLPLLRALSKRSFAAEAGVKPASCALSEVKVTTLPNKMVVASADCNNQGLVKISVAVRAGSRYETPENYGASNIIRSAAGLTTASASKFSIIRNLQRIGSSLTATSDRETIVYTLETTSDNLSSGLKYLKAVTTEASFKPWELADNVPRIQYELANVPSTAKLMDDLHKAAYRKGLGNSVFVKNYNIKKLGPETLQHYVNDTFLTDRTALAGVGVSHATLEEFAKELCMETGKGPSEAARYYGGEVRMEANTHITHVAYAAEASGLGKKEVFAYAVLRCALGGGRPAVKWGAGAGPLHHALDNIQGPTATQAFLASHSDSGLFGIIISATPDNIGAAVKAGVKALHSGVKDSDISRGKAQLKAEVLYSAEECGSLAGDLAAQAALLGTARHPQALAEAIDQVTPAQVQDVLKKVLEGQKSLAAIGNLYNVPFLADLK